MTEFLIPAISAVALLAAGVISLRRAASKPEPTQPVREPLGDRLWRARTNRLKRFIELDAPHVVTAHEAVLVIRSFSGNSRWRSVRWFIQEEIVRHYKGELYFNLYSLRFRLTGKDPDGLFVEDEEADDEFERDLQQALWGDRKR